MNQEKYIIADYQIVFYRIAGLLMEIILPSHLLVENVFPTCTLFRADKKTDEESLCSTCVYIGKSNEIIGNAKLLSDISVIWGNSFRFYELQNGKYLTVVKSDNENMDMEMVSSKDFKSNKIFIKPNYIQDQSSIITWLLMVIFAQAALEKNTILIHSSVVEKDGQAFGFLGKSGTGKSTHSQLWLKYLSDFCLLNDDNPAIQLANDGSVSIYGTPWSGKTPCYRNEKRTLKGLVRLKQQSFNKFQNKINKEALITLLPSCSALRWNTNLFSRMTDILTEVIKRVPIGHLECLPDQEAVSLCYQEITSNK